MRQRYGQNFLMDNNIAANVVKAADLQNSDNVLEIGPGKGILTKLIQPKVKQLTAVEIDGRLFQQLNHFFSFNKITNIELINQDFLKYSVSDIECKFISNLPYNAGTAIIQKVLPLKNWSIAIFMLQKEVISSLAAKHGSKDYGYISIFTSYYTDAKILFDVSPKCFNPPPKVLSSVIKLVNKNPDPADTDFFGFVKHAFSMRRKTILNSLSSFCDIHKDEAAKILKDCGLNTLLRPDTLSISDFLSLTNEIKNRKINRI